MSLVLHGTDGVTFNDSSLQGAAASPFVLKNRIINGAMVIDQRNAGASTTPTGAGSGIYTLDRWCYQAAQTGKVTVQQNAGAVTPPTGFKNYAGITSASSYSVLTSDYFHLYQAIEGFNVSDLNWGTANAQTITISFWVRSSLTGTFGGSLRNAAVTRSYPFTYTISVANTWEYKTVTIAGDTSGTWATDNTVGIYVGFGLGSGATFSGTAGAWGAGNFVQPTSTVSVIGTNGATWYITGVQLEIGSTATPFERRLYGQELINCQRYYQQWGKSSNIAYRPYAVGSFTSTTLARMIIPTMATMRTAPSFTFNNATNSFIRLGSTSAAATSVTLDISSPEAIMYNVNIASGGTEGRGTTHFQNDTNSTSLELSAEL